MNAFNTGRRQAGQFIQAFEIDFLTEDTPKDGFLLAGDMENVYLTPRARQAYLRGWEVSFQDDVPTAHLPIVGISR